MDFEIVKDKTLFAGGMCIEIHLPSCCTVANVASAFLRLQGIPVEATRRDVEDLFSPYGGKL
jgi:hypothetical protein